MERRSAHDNIECLLIRSKTTILLESKTSRMELSCIFFSIFNKSSLARKRRKKRPENSSNSNSLPLNSGSFQYRKLIFNYYLSLLIQTLARFWLVRELFHFTLREKCNKNSTAHIACMPTSRQIAMNFIPFFSEHLK